MKWRKLFRTVHRDTGYVVAALTIAYVISGVAVNHISDWNPSYKFRDDRVNVGALPAGSYKQMEQHVVAALAIDPKTVKGHFMESPTEFRVFLTDSQEVRVDVATGIGSRKRVVRRALFYEVNALHLNALKGIWTWVADLFALSLLVLVITGLFMMKGSRGIGGRGKWFVTAGTAIPILFVLHLYLGCADGLRAPPYSDKHPNFTFLAKKRLHRMMHLEGGDYKMTAHYRKIATGVELCRIEINGRYTQSKKFKRSYRLDLYGLATKGLAESTFKVAEKPGTEAMKLHFEIDGKEQFYFDAGKIRVKKFRTVKGPKGLNWPTAMGATFNVKRDGKRYLGAFFVEGAVSVVDGQCTFAKREPVPEPDLLGGLTDAGIKR